jgi:hypothetical protein
MKGIAMKNKFKMTLFCLVTAASAALTLPSFAREYDGRDPDRWYREDMTPEAKYQTARKEASAAYRQAMDDCRHLYRAERSACMRDAKINYDTELEEANRRFHRRHR